METSLVGTTPTTIYITQHNTNYINYIQVNTIPITTTSFITHPTNPFHLTGLSHHQGL